VKEYKRAYGTCEALEEILMGFFVMCFAHSDSWRLMWKKKKKQKVFRTSDTLNTGTFCRDGSRHALLLILLANHKRPCIAVALPFSGDEDKIGGSAIHEI